MSLRKTSKSATCSMAQIRELAEKKPIVKESLMEAVSPVKITLADIAHRLEL